MNRTTLIAVLTAACVSVAAAPAYAQKTLKLAHDLEPSHTVAITFENMAQDLEKISGGKLKMRVYPSSQMGSARETLELLLNGGLDMTKGSSNLDAFAPVYSVWSLPYLFRDKEHADAVVYGPVGREIMASTKDKGFIALAAYDTGTRSLFTKKPITTPEDLKGLKIRVQPSPTSLKMIELMGGSPTPINFGEVYTALQQGVIDGAENNIPTWVQTRVIEVANVYTENEHTMVPDFLIVSSKIWDTLTPEEQGWLKQAAENSETFERELWAKVMTEAREQSKALGGTIVPADKAAFVKAVQPLLDEYAKDPANKALLDKIQAVGK
ncbi:MAG: TRAP transporter substrate-binding protein [Methylobacteriaceae bacterium]|jgi:tripartite ATP-independent transporter DctP family solute receptor|nr:TRAP transporter substrate-binding protein [Methylobacteriaceae bacterium]